MHEQVDPARRFRNWRRMVSSGSAVKRTGSTLMLQSAGTELKTTPVKFPSPTAAKSAARNLLVTLRLAAAAGEISSAEDYNLACGQWLESMMTELKQHGGR